MVFNNNDHRSSGKCASSPQDRVSSRVCYIQMRSLWRRGIAPAQRPLQINLSSPGSICQHYPAGGPRSATRAPLGSSCRHHRDIDPAPRRRVEAPPAAWPRAATCAAQAWTRTRENRRGLSRPRRPDRCYRRRLAGSDGSLSSSHCPSSTTMSCPAWTSDAASMLSMAREACCTRLLEALLCFHPGSAVPGVFICT